MRNTSLNAPQGTSLSMHEADKASYSEWPQFLSCKFEAFENTNHDSALTFDRRGSLKISERDLQEPRSGQNGSKFRYATTRRGLGLKLSIALGFKLHDQRSQEPEHAQGAQAQAAPWLCTCDTEAIRRGGQHAKVSLEKGQGLASNSCLMLCRAIGCLEYTIKGKGS